MKSAVPPHAPTPVHPPLLERRLTKSKRWLLWQCCAVSAAAVAVAAVAVVAAVTVAVTAVAAFIVAMVVAVIGPQL